MKYTVFLTSLHICIFCLILLARKSSAADFRCLPQIRNTTLPIREFQYVNATSLYFLSNCIEPLPNDLLRYKVDCPGEKRDNLDLAICDKDENLQKGLKNCEKIVAAPVEVHGDEERIVVGEYKKILRRGFELNYSSSSECSTCEREGGRCGFNTTIFKFRCFCPDRPRPRGCRSRRADSATGRNKLKLILIAGNSSKF
ncbi:Hypothetical predicted protein [Olea europaea subsp. europaea]|uniref:Wall-associated receptor kinase C-terminal domain-containing protein n=1 Tax=Olea europaea subsp. europaea TaxID=158383 RepID=A0A8S0RB97_OLEEU|nr:Hypothetical predicted protein [Olea europaea subsp. europaea]